MTEARNEHGVALLPNGRVLIAGGYHEARTVRPLYSARIFDSRTGVWESAGALSKARAGADLIALASGDAVIIGGETPGEKSQKALDSAERFDAATGQWWATSSLSQSRIHTSSVRLQDGRVIAIGGASRTPHTDRLLPTAEIYDPSTNSWSLTSATLNFARAGHDTILLRDGRVLVIGGEVPFYVNTLVSELYNPATDSFTVAGNTNDPRSDASVTLLPDGRVLVVGGWNPQGNPESQAVHTSAEIYDPVKGNWEAVASPRVGRRHHAAFVLPSGRVMIAGGTNGTVPIASTEIYDPDADSWQAGPDMPHAMFNRSATAISLPAGMTLVTGGLSPQLFRSDLAVMDASQVFEFKAP